ncbi:hypothetical protein BJF88_05785 [Cellulosimicrobium sp. CUA-896]|nr:hypothetical protein BJF88_05785 [Cellulosimicrobium sp. CUA-896]
MRGAVVHGPRGTVLDELTDRGRPGRRRAGRAGGDEHERDLDDEVDALAHETHEVQVDPRPRRDVTGPGRRGRRDVEREGHPRLVPHGDALDRVPAPRGQPGVEEREQVGGGGARAPCRHLSLPSRRPPRCRQSSSVGGATTSQ